MTSLKKARAKQLGKPRNPLWADPLLRKGGPHEKTKKALRRSDKVRTLKDYKGG